MEEILRFIKKIIPKSLFTALQPLYHFSLAFLAVLWYRFPSKKLIVVGVTGTKGKTTAVELIHGVLALSSATVASASSLSFRVGEHTEDNRTKMTTPGRFFVQKFLRRAADAGCKFAVIEMTSEAIKQFRYRFVSVDVAVMTHIASEHIESHGSFEKYLRTKLDLFWRIKREGISVINRDDRHAERFSAATAAPKVWYGREGIAAGKTFYPVTRLAVRDNGVQFEIGGYEFKSALRGEFNFYNILAAIAVGISEHMPLEKIKIAIEGVTLVPGRMEVISADFFEVVVDYAHTPDSLRLVYEFFHKKIKNSSGKNPGKRAKLICVFGAAGGGRDKWKRPEFGKIAEEFCEKIFITNEDPYDEDPEEIMQDIVKGISRGKQNLVSLVADRAVAIRNALAAAGSGDIVIFTGKGAEPWIMGPNNTKMWWDEKEEIKLALAEIGKRKE